MTPSNPIGVIDYGMGNLHSVRKALEVVGAKVKVSSSSEDIKKAKKIVFPGVGAFGEAMKELKRRSLVQPIKDAIKAGTPFLGLCLGMQLLFEKSDEAPGIKGLCVLGGEVKRFKVKELKVPHMGWNNIAYGMEFQKLIPTTENRKIVIAKRFSCRLTAYNSKILKGVPNGSYMYFVHSYFVLPKDKNVILTTTDYDINFMSGVCKDNIYGFQFHPEKSQALGLKILKNFVDLK